MLEGTAVTRVKFTLGAIVGSGAHRNLTAVHAHYTVRRTLRSSLEVGIRVKGISANC